MKAHEQENLLNKLSALFEERETGVILKGKEAESTMETSLLVPATCPPEEEDRLAGELNGDVEEDVLSSHQKQELLQVSSPQEMELSANFAKDTTKPKGDTPMQTLQVNTARSVCNMTQQEYRYASEFK